MKIRIILLFLLIFTFNSQNSAQNLKFENVVLGNDTVTIRITCQILPKNDVQFHKFCLRIFRRVKLQNVKDRIALLKYLQDTTYIGDSFEQFSCKFLWAVNDWLAQKYLPKVGNHWQTFIE
jgi:hypothetical protein